MSTILGYRVLNRSASVGVGSKDFKSGKVNFVNLENRRVQRDLARHGTLGQYVMATPPRFQLDTGTVELGGQVTPRTASLVLDVAATQLLALDKVTTGASVAGTATVAPDAANPQLSAIGLDTTTFATPTVAAVILNTAAASVTEQRTLSFPSSLTTFPAVDTTAARTWLALVWVPPRLASVTGVAATGVFTKAAHGFNIGDPVWFNAVTGATAGLVVSTIYYVNSVPSSSTFTVSATLGGATLLWTTDVSAGAVQRQILAADVLDIRP